MSIRVALLALLATAGTLLAVAVQAAPAATARAAAPPAAPAPADKPEIRADIFLNTPGVKAPAPISGPPLKRRVCVWDIAGANGDLFRSLQDMRIGILRYGIDLELMPYTSERVAAEDFKAGQCDAVNLLTMRARNFIRYSGSLDAIGALPTREHLRLALIALADPRLAPKLKSGPYEVAAFIPIGAAYIFTNDRNVTSIARASGKRVAVLDHDPTMSKMVAGIGATPIPSDVTNFAGKFNNGSVDIIAAPLAAYRPFELWKGLEPHGGIVDYPFTQLTAQVLVRSDKFPPEMLQYARTVVARHFESTMEIVDAMIGEVPEKYWVKIPKTDQLRYEFMMREARIQLREEGYYDGEMLTLLRKIRCKVDSGRGECTDKQE